MLAPSAPPTISPVLAPAEPPVAGLRMLVATNGSPASQRATAVAAALVAECAGQLVVVHVLAALEVRVVRLGPTVESVSWSDDPFSDPVLLAARRLAWMSGVVARVALVAGPPADGIVIVARQISAGLIVMGRGRAPGWRAGWLAASTRARVERRAAVPVLAVPAVRGGQAAPRGVPAVVVDEAWPC